MSWSSPWRVRSQPKVNKDIGRDHWAPAASLLFAGAGVKPGRVIGATDKDGGQAVDSPIRPADVACTVYRSLGIDRKSSCTRPTVDLWQSWTRVTRSRRCMRRHFLAGFVLLNPWTLRAEDAKPPVPPKVALCAPLAIRSERRPRSPFEAGRSTKRPQSAATATRSRSKSSRKGLQCSRQAGCKTDR